MKAILILLFILYNIFQCDCDYESTLNTDKGSSSHRKYENGFEKFFSDDRVFWPMSIGLVILQSLVLYFMGQPIISRSCKVKLWEGDINGPENSQHMTDWYTFTHILHGFGFYAVGAGIAAIWPTIDIGIKGIFIVSLFIEALWEAIENSPPVIERYRQQALANGYTGDSILNSICDTFAMTIGFWVAYLIPWWVLLLLTLAEEIFLAIAIRDNLVLNIIQLIYPFECISKWQTNSKRNINNIPSQDN